MAVKLRLTRMGGKKSPFYRIVAIDSRKARDGQYIEQIGIYNPVKTPAEVRINNEIAKKWLDRGAQPTETVRNLFYNAGIIESAKVFQKVAAAATEVATEVATDDDKE